MWRLSLAGFHMKLAAGVLAGSLMAMAIDPGISSIVVVILGAAISFLTARYWLLQSTAVKEANRLANEHRALVHRVIELERRMSLQEQRCEFKCPSQPQRGPR